MQSSTSKADAAAARPRKLGRGLSSLLAAPVSVEPPAVEAARPKQITNTPVSPQRPALQDDAVAPAARSTPPEERIERIPVAAIRPSPYQPRRTFDQGALERLAASIRVAGVMQPVLVRRVEAVGGFELIAGERRLRAAQLAGLAAIPAVVATVSDEKAAEWALIENLQREELGAMERAWGLRSLVEKFGLTHAEAAERVGLDRSSVTNLLRLTELEQPVQSLLEDRRLSLGHGKALLGMPAGAGRAAIAERAAARGWSVRQVERAVARLTRVGAAASTTGSGDAPAANALARLDLERQLGEYLGTKVHVKANKKGTKGQLVVEFYNLDHFDGLMARIGFEVK